MASFNALLQHQIPFTFSVAAPLLSARPGSSLRRGIVVAQSVPINPSIKKDEAKVVDQVVVSELEKPITAYCRCWRSGMFPLCDGTHAKHNKETGDNVGPLLLKK